MPGHSFAGLLQLLCACHVAAVAFGAEWQVVRSVGCLPDSQARQTTRSRSSLECAFATDGLLDLPVAQWRPRSGFCSAFAFADACPTLLAAATAAGDCDLLSPLPVRDFVGFLRAVAAFSGVWILGEQASTSLVNLACDPTLRWQPASVEWTPAGARFNGVTSKLTMNGTRLTPEFGMTWLMRLRRQPSSHQEFVDAFECASGLVGPHLVEYSAPGSLTYDTFNVADQRRRFTIAGLLTLNPNQFFDVGVTGVPADGVNSVFHNGGFVSAAPSTETRPTAAAQKFDCMYIGCRYGSSIFLDGTVRLVALANRSMSEAEIDAFFKLVK